MNKMGLKAEKFETKPECLRAHISSFNAETRTFTAVASVGSKVLRGGFFEEAYYQELEMSREAIDMTRFENGAPFLDTHGLTANGATGLRDVLGVVTNPRLEARDGKTQLIVDVKLSMRDDVTPIARDIEDGILRNVSIGFNIRNNVETDERFEGRRVFMATRWEPVELSGVPAGADPDAQIRAQENKKTCETVFQYRTVDEVESSETIESESSDSQVVESDSNVDDNSDGSQRVAENETTGDLNLEKEVKDAIAAERQRAKEIRGAVKLAKLDSDVADEMIERGVTVDEARKEVLEAMAKKDSETATTGVRVGEDLTREGVNKGIADAILHRAIPGKFEMTKEGKKYERRRLADLCRDSLEAKGESTRNLTDFEIAKRGLHSTSDFPEILADVTNKTLRRAYEESPQTFAPFTTRTTVSDFKEISRVQFGDAPVLEKKLENGEYKHGTIGEAAEKYFVEDYGKVVAVGRHVIVNDDLSALTQLPAKMGVQARNLESSLIWNDVIIANPIMSDGLALFSAGHGNLGSAGALSETTLSEGRKLMRLQKGLGGNELNLMPSYLAVPATLETTANKLLTQVMPDSTGNVNVFSGMLTQGTEPRLDADSPSAHYLFAGLGQIDMVELATLVGEEAPVVDSMMDFYTDGVKYKIRYTLGVKAIDYRGMVKLPG